jgi:hypothetical protein
MRAYRRRIMSSPSVVCGLDPIVRRLEDRIEWNRDGVTIGVHNQFQTAATHLAAELPELIGPQRANAGAVIDNREPDILERSIWLTGVRDLSQEQEFPAARA